MKGEVRYIVGNSYYQHTSSGENYGGGYVLGIFDTYEEAKQKLIDYYNSVSILEFIYQNESTFNGYNSYYIGYAIHGKTGKYEDGMFYVEGQVNGEMLEDRLHVYDSWDETDGEEEERDIIF